MYNGQRITEPKMFCPECGQRMYASYHDATDDMPPTAVAECPKGHKVVLRVRAGSDDKLIVDQLAYLVKYDGGRVEYESE